MRIRIISLIFAVLLIISSLSVPAYAAPIETEEEIIPTASPIKFTPESLVYDETLKLTIKATVKDMSKLGGSYMQFAVGNTNIPAVSFSSLTPDADGAYRFECEIPTQAGTSFKAAFVYGTKSITLNGTLSLVKASKATCTEYGTQKYSLKFDKVSYGTLLSGEFRNPNEKPLGHSYVDGVCSECGSGITAGDIDANGKVNSADANMLKQIVVGIMDSCPQAEVNGDGKVNATDVNALKLIIVGLDIEE